MPTAIPIIGPAYTSKTLLVNAQELINLRFEAGGPGGRDALVGTSGLKLFVTTETNPVRGMIQAGGDVLVVVGENLYNITVLGAKTIVGTIEGTARVSMAATLTEVFIAAGAKSYLYDISAETVAEITDVDLPVTNSVTSQDGYFLMKGPDGKIVGTALNDGATIPSTFFAVASGSPDDMVALISDHRELFALGETSVQLYDNIGGSDFPFATRQGVFIEVGCAAAASVVKGDNSIFWLSNSEQGERQIVRLSGYQPITISTPVIDDEIQGYTTVSDAFGLIYKEGGHTYYALTFPSENVTWEFDASVGDPAIAWHKRSSFTIGRWCANAHVAINGVHYFGDCVNGKIYTLDKDTFDEDGRTISRTRTFPHLPPAFYGSLQVDFEAGTGLLDGQQGDDPVAMLDWSSDGGKTYPGSQIFQKMGKRGKFEWKTRWNRLGRAKVARTFRINITDPVKVAMVGAKLEAELLGD